MAQFETGHSKLGGRTKGKPNRRTVILADAIDQLGCDIPRMIIDLLPELCPEKQVSVLVDLLQYLYPKRSPFPLLRFEHQILEPDSLHF